LDPQVTTAMSFHSSSTRAVFAAACLLLGCGGRPEPAASISRKGAGASASAATSPSPPAASTDPAEGATAGAAPEESRLFGRIDEDKAAQELGDSFAKLLQIAKLSPKTHKSLLKSYLFRAESECPGQTLVEIKPATGLLVAKSELKIRARAYEKLKAAGMVAKQRGTAIEVVTGHAAVKDTLDQWNQAIIDASLKLINAAAPADQKDKNFAPGAKTAVGEELNPKGWESNVCETGRLGGWSVEVQLVTLDASGQRGTVLVKGGADAERFTRDNFESTYWDKPTGKSFRTLTEIMAVGGFVRQCSAPDLFMTSPTMAGTWRCKQGPDSWDPPNRPIPVWQ
jgi:hypothetical protein